MHGQKYIKFMKIFLEIQVSWNVSAILIAMYYVLCMILIAMYYVLCTIRRKVLP